MVTKLEDEPDDVPFGWKWLIEDLDDSTAEEKILRVMTSLMTPDLQSKFRVMTKSISPWPQTGPKKNHKGFRKRKGVLVQGPPGTGKSHTITNLISHLLAEGKKLLITAETPRALKVLKSKLEEEVSEIAPICVNALGSGTEEKNELDRSVNKIVEKHSKWNSERNEEQIQTNRIRLKSVREELAETKKKIVSLREDETLTHTLGNGLYHGTATNIAKQVAEGRSSFDWIGSIPKDSNHQSPLSNEEMVKWLQISLSRSEEDLIEAKRRIVGLDELASPEEFSSQVDLLLKTQIASEEDAASRENPSFPTLSSLRKMFLSKSIIRS